MASKSKLNNPFIGKPYTQGAPGGDAAALAKLGNSKMPKGAAFGRLAAALAKPPKQSLPRGSKNFLP